MVSTNNTGVAGSISETMCSSTTDSAPNDDTSAMRPTSGSRIACSSTATAA